MGYYMGRDVFHHGPMSPLILETRAEAARGKQVRISTHDPASDKDSVVGTVSQRNITSVLTQNFEEQVNGFLGVIIVLRRKDLRC